MRERSITATSQNEGYARLRYGYISDYDASRHMARVIFPELDNMVSGWLQIIVEHTKRDYMKDGKEHICKCHHYGGIGYHHDEYYMAIGEQVACLMNGTGTENGVILGCIYDEVNRP